MKTVSTTPVTQILPTEVRMRPEESQRLTFLHMNEILGLCTAYFVMTSNIREYSSDEPRSADRRVGVL